MGYIGACLVRNIGLFSCCVVPRQPGLVGVSVSSYPGSLVSVPPVGIFIDWKVGCRITPDRLQFCLFVLSVEQWSKMNITLWRSVRKCIEALAATFSHCICILSRHPLNNNCQFTKSITHETRAGGPVPLRAPGRAWGDSLRSDAARGSREDARRSSDRRGTISLCVRDEPVGDSGHIYQCRHHAAPSKPGDNPRAPKSNTCCRTRFVWRRPSSDPAKECRSD